MMGLRHAMRFTVGKDCWAAAQIFGSHQGDMFRVISGQARYRILFRKAVAGFSCSHAAEAA